MKFSSKYSFTKKPFYHNFLLRIKAKDQLKGLEDNYYFLKDKLPKTYFALKLTTSQKAFSMLCISTYLSVKIFDII